MNKNLLFLLLLSSCSLAPSFSPPDVKTPENFKEDEAQKPQGVWKEAVPLEKESRGEWWKIFEDSALDDLEKEALAANASLQAAAARVEASRAVVRANSSEFLPKIDIGGNAVRAKAADASTAGFSSGPPTVLKPYTLYSAGAMASYEIDLFARVLDNERALSFEADAEEALYKSALLALQADVAQHYFMLQTIDAQRVLLKETVTVRAEASRIMEKRFEVGSVGGVDAARTQAELASANADLIILDRRRAVVENALAVLLGKNPSDYHFAEAPLADTAPPFIPPGIPSDVMQRRPDIASAILRMQAANKRVGVARTAFFPRLILTATGGFQSTDLGDIFKWSSRNWALGQLAGDALSMTLFDNGRNIARVDLADATYKESLANYRQQVLIAMGEVENALTDQKLLSEQSREQDVAAQATRRSNMLIQKRYDMGDVNYFEVVDAQRSMLAANLAALDTHGARLLATITLIRALGGGWVDTPPLDTNIASQEPVLALPSKLPKESSPETPEANGVFIPAVE